jgi:hypothetical protein
VINLSEQCLHEVSDVAAKANPRRTFSIRDSLAAFGSYAFMCVTVLVLFWALIAFSAWPDPRIDKPRWNGRYVSGTYRLNDFLRSGGLDLSKNLPLSFGPEGGLNSDKPSFSLLATDGRTVRLSLQWRGSGYIVDVPATIVALRLNAANTVRVRMKSSRETTEHKRHLVAILRPYNPVNIFFFRYWQKREEYTPITSTKTWKRMQLKGVGAFFSSNRSLVRSVTITLTPQAYQQYAARLPLSN